MKTFTSETKHFKCSCQENLIKVSEIRKHLNSKIVHNIKPFSTKQSIKLQEPDSLTTLKHSIKAQFPQTHNDIMSIASRLLKLLLNLETLDISPTSSSNSKTHFNPNPSSQNESSIKATTIKIQKDLNKFPIKEITFFKNLKQNFKTGFSIFMQKSGTSIDSIVLSDKFLITGGLDGVLRVWNPNDLQLVKNRFFHKGRILALDVDPSSKYLLSGGRDKMICLWDTNGFKLQKYFIGHEYRVTSLKFISGDKIFVSGSDDKTLRVWNSYKNELIRIFSFDKSVDCIIKLVPFNSVIAFCVENQILLFDFSWGKVVGKYEQKFDYIFVVFAEDNKIVAADEDGMIQVIDAKRLKILDTTKVIKGGISSIDYNSKSKIVAASLFDGYIKLFSFFNLNQSKILSFYSEVFTRIKFGFNRLYCCGFEGKIHFYYDENIKSHNRTELKSYNPNSICISTKLQLVCYGSRSIYLYCLINNEDIAIVHIFAIATCLSFVNSILLCGTNKGKLMFYNVPDLQILKVFDLSKSSIFFAMVSKDFNMLVFSDSYKSKLLSYESNSVILNISTMILSGRFNEKFNYFVFVDQNRSVFVSRNYYVVIKISRIYFSYQIFFSVSDEKLVFRDASGAFVLIDLNKKAVLKTMNKVRELDPDLMYPTKSILVSCLNFSNILNYW